MGKNIFKYKYSVTLFNFFAGLPENVEKAKEEIEAYIAARTGSHHTSIDDDFKNNGTEVGNPSTNSNYMEAAISAPFQTKYFFYFDWKSLSQKYMKHI